MSQTENEQFPKKRKSYFRYIQRNIEFYLSDANLRRDKFLKNQINDQLEVKASIFLGFNKIKYLNATLEDVIVALRPSKVLEMKPNGIVKRRFPIVDKTQEELDQCCLYVERIPPDVTHEFFVKIFSPFGKVALVSIPKYKTNKKVKGYAFIEFEDPKSCSAAIRKFASFGEVMGRDALAIHDCYMECPKTEPHSTESKPVSETIPPLASDALTTKDGIDEIPKESLVAMDCEAGPSELKKDETEVKDESAVVPLPKKRKKNRKKKKWQRKVDPYPHMGLQIMSKTAWNLLKKRYLSIQAANRRSIKLQLSKLKRPSIRPPKLNAIIPGSIVLITATKPITDAEANHLKSHLKQYENVEYVDVESGLSSGYVRLASADAANWLLSNAAEVLPGYKIEPLPKTSEEKYWIKIENDRNNRLKPSKDKKSIGGSKKVMRRAEKQLGVKIILTPDHH